MIKQLIKNELFKIIKKRSTLFFLIFSLLFVVFTNILYKSINRYDMKQIGSIDTYSEVDDIYLKKAIIDYDTSLIEEDKALANYVIETKEDIYSASNGKLMQAFFNEYNLLIVLWLVLLSCGIVSNEFQSGNIKNLLMIPGDRRQILLAKIVSILLLLFAFVLYLLLLQLIIGSFVLDFSSVFHHNVYYNAVLKRVVKINVLWEFILNLLGYIPMYLIVISFGLLLSTLFTSSGISIIILLFSYMVSNTILELIVKYKFSWLKILPFAHWNITDQIFGRNNNLLYTKWPFSVIICMSYVILLVYLTFKIFQNKDV